MLLRRFTDQLLKSLRLASPALLLFAAGCATTGTVGGAQSPSGDSNVSASTGDAGPQETVDGAGGDIVVPPKALTLYEQATATMAAGDFVEAEFRLKEFLLNYPQFPGAYVNLGIIYANRGDDEKTRAAIDAALDLDPDYAPALNQLGMLLRRNGNFLEAEAAYLKAVTVSPAYALAHYNLGVLNELYLQRLDVALQHFEEYQTLVGEDKQVEKWIVDLTRRVAASQRTANVAD